LAPDAGALFITAMFIKVGVLSLHTTFVASKTKIAVVVRNATHISALLSLFMQPILLHFYKKHVTKTLTTDNLTTINNKH
jgi:hypothetical protein